ncbi:MAG: sodium-translocating pyrophosphatase [Candidatus Micrarchaeota archaeon]
MQSALTIGFVIGLISLLYAAYLTFVITKAPKGNEKMQSIAKAIHTGADAFLSRQYKTLLPVVLVLFVVIWLGLNSSTTAITFLLGVVSSALAGYVGMQVSVRANVRVAETAKKGMASALDMAFKGGAVTGFALAGLGLVGLVGTYVIFGNTNALIGYAFGASLISLFSRVGGGIYTKAADVGADLVGKVEKGIPEDDPRNPAVIADNVGDNVGDCAGMAADVFESFVVTVMAAMLLGNPAIPILIASAGVLASIIGSLFVKLAKNNNIMGAFYNGIFATAIIMLALSYVMLVVLLPGNNFSLFLSVVIGVAVTILMFYVTEYYTAKEYSPVQEIANAGKTGAATTIIQGLAIGMESTLLPTIIIIAAIAAAYSLGGVYAVAVAASAMLSMSAIIIAIDAYGPITDNAGGIAEMSGLDEKIRKVTDALDAVGNTTKATTKGYAIAGAALGALALFASFAVESKLTSINLLQPSVTIGLFIGALLPFIFSSLLIRAVGKAAFEIVEEVRRQFREIKGLMEGKATPDYAKCVDISTKTALRELTLPGIIAVFTPLLVGYVFGVAALGGLLAGAIASGFLLALVMTTAGAAWDNAKKYIEGGALGGKGSDTHKAAVVGDTVGDPLKDTAGPSLNALIKVVNTVSLVFASILVAKSIGILG